MAKETKEDCLFGAIQIGEPSYKADLAILDRYLKFTKEILRLSLLAITGEVTCLQTVFGWKLKGIDFSKIDYKWVNFVSLILFVLAVAFSLFHRFQASDGFARHIEFLRAVEDNDDKRLINQSKLRDFQYKISGWALNVSCWALGFGVAAFVISMLLNF